MTFWKNRKTVLYVDRYSVLKKKRQKFRISNGNDNFTFTNGYILKTQGPIYLKMTTLLHIDPKDGQTYELRIIATEITKEIIY